MDREPHKNPVCAVLWQDAAYSFESTLPSRIPLPQLTVGFVMEANDTFIHMATNVAYDATTKQLRARDGILIPKQSILDFRKIGSYE